MTLLRGSVCRAVAGCSSPIADYSTDSETTTMLALARVTFSFALIGTVSALLKCEDHPSCAARICFAFDDVCSDDEICQQFDGSGGVWYKCHPKFVIDGCENHGCGVGTECHNLGSMVLCTCQDTVVDVGVPCESNDGGPTSSGTSPDDNCTKACHESARCEVGFDGISMFCVCNDGHLMDAGVACPHWNGNDET